MPTKAQLSDHQAGWGRLTSPASWRRGLLAPVTVAVLILAVGLMVTQGLWRSAIEGLEREAGVHLETGSRMTIAALERRVDEYQTVLLGLQGLFAVSADVRRDEFRRYYHSLIEQASMPRVIAMHFTRKLAEADKAAFVAAVRRDRSLDEKGFPDFAIHPDLPLDEHFVIDYIEPLERNRAAFGLDAASQPANLASFLAARDSGKIGMTPPFRLAQLREGEPGLVMRAPVYRASTPPGSAEERRAAFIGLVGVSLNAAELFGDVFAEPFVAGLQVHIDDVTGDTSKTPAEPMRQLIAANFDESADRTPGSDEFRKVTIIPVGGRLWEVSVQPTGEWLAIRLGGGSPRLIYAAGIVISVLLSLLYLAMARSRFRAQELAERMTLSLRQSEKHSREGMERFRVLFESSPDPVWIIENNTFVECNRAAAQILGYSSNSELLFVHPSKLSPEFQPDGESSFVKAERMMQLAREKGIHRFEWIHTRANGENFTAEVTLCPIALQGREAIYCAWRDISEFKRAAQALRQSEEDLRSLVENSPLPMIVATPPPEGRTLLMNKRFVETFGYRVEDIPDLEHWWPTVYPDPVYREDAIMRWGKAMEAMVRAGLNRLSEPFAAEITCKNGTTRLVEINLTVQPNRALVVLNDVTERTLAEQALRQSEEELNRHRLHLEQLVGERTRELAGKNQALEGALVQLQQAQNQLIQESKLASLGGLVAGVAHELNTPIGNARVISDTLFDRCDEFVNRLEKADAIRKSEFVELLNQLRDGTRILDHNLIRASGLIHSFKQVAVDRTSSQRRKFNLRAVVDEVILTMHPALKKLPFVISTDISPDIELDSYPGPFGQVLVNLVENALSHGLLGRACGKIEITGRQTGGMAELVVADDGCGIPEENLSRIFDPFFTTRLGQGGSGLGLSIVFNIVNGLLGGKILVSSSPVSGTRFTVLIALSAPLHSGQESGFHFRH